jgi:hypothetical protein
MQALFVLFEPQFIGGYNKPMPDEMEKSFAAPTITGG